MDVDSPHSPVHPSLPIHLTLIPPSPTHLLTISFAFSIIFKMESILWISDAKCCIRLSRWQMESPCRGALPAQLYKLLNDSKRYVIQICMVSNRIRVPLLIIHNPDKISLFSFDVYPHVTAISHNRSLDTELMNVPNQ